MASQDLLEALLAEEPPALQQVQSPEQEKRPTLVEGSFQSCEGHIERRSKILKRWKKEYIKVIPGTAYATSYGRGLWAKQEPLGQNWRIFTCFCYKLGTVACETCAQWRGMLHEPTSHP